MATLSISDFSCLRNAVFELSPINVIIGPQGSGKSVTTKLLYFFTDIVGSHITYAERGNSIEDYKNILAKNFSLWFPPSAWGKGRFNLNYTAGDFSVRILRRRRKGQISDDVSIIFSDWFTEFYSKTESQFKKAAEGEENIEDESQLNNVYFDTYWRIRETRERLLASRLRENYFAAQTFVPAGRAFFTSIGRLVAGFEQAGSLDPITIKFARLFASLRDRPRIGRLSRNGRLSPEFIEKRNSIMAQLFGGEVKFGDESEYVETDDGRKIPFSSLSSGQQELLPMWSLIDYFNERDHIRNTRSSQTYRPREIVYIEEPEAHLFPSAQSTLMDFLIGSVASERSRRNLIITTHSPYVMSKLNVFLKAGQLSKRKKRNQDINEIVPRECWLSEKQISALAIENGSIRNLIDEDGLIDGRYLDDISEEISRQFSGLLQIESEI